jgi:hypothetical protein
MGNFDIDPNLLGYPRRQVRSRCGRFTRFTQVRFIMPDTVSTSRPFVLKAVLFEGSLGLAAVVLGCWMTVPPWRQIRGDATDAAWGLAATVPLLAMMLALRQLNAGPFRRLNRAVDELLVPLFSGCTLSDFALISLVGGLGEELLFRGLIQAVLSHWFGLVAGLVLASILFGLAHMITLTYAVIAALVGAFFGWLWIHFDNLLVPIVAHAVYDFAALAYLMRSGPPAPSQIDTAE